VKEFRNFETHENSFEKMRWNVQREEKAQGRTRVALIRDTKTDS
jgi:hypothetical protein